MANKLTEFVEKKCKLDSHFRDEDGVLHDRMRPIIQTHLPDLESLLRGICDELEKKVFDNDPAKFWGLDSDDIRSVFSEYITLDNNG